MEKRVPDARVALRRARRFVGEYDLPHAREQVAYIRVPRVVSKEIDVEQPVENVIVRGAGRQVC